MSQWLVEGRYYTGADGQVVAGPFGPYSAEPEGYVPPDGCHVLEVGPEGLDYEQTQIGQAATDGADSGAAQASGRTRSTGRSTADGNPDASASTDGASDLSNAGTPASTGEGTAPQA